VCQAGKVLTYGQAGKLFLRVLNITAQNPSTHENLHADKNDLHADRLRMAAQPLGFVLAQQ